MSAPILQEVYLAILHNDWKSVLNLYQNHPEAMRGYRIIASTQNNCAHLIDDYERLLNEVPFFTSIFSGPRLVFFSPKLITASGFKIAVEIDWSVSIDSNVGEKIRAYFNGESIDPTNLERVIALIRAKEKYALNFDLISFLNENLRLSRGNIENIRPLNSFIAFKAMDYLDWESFEMDPYNPRTTRDWADISNEYSQVYTSMINIDAVKMQEGKALFVNAFLLELSRQWLKWKASPIVILERLIEFCVFELGKLPIFELSLAWDFLNNPKGLMFFGPLAGTSKSLVSKLRAMAWDLTHLRAMEMMATNYDREKFYIPLFVSFDKGLRELILANPIQHLIMNSETKTVVSVRERDLNFQQIISQVFSVNANLSKASDFSASRRGSHLNAEKLASHIVQLEVEVEKLVQEARKRS